MGKKKIMGEIDMLTQELMINHVEDFFREQELPFDDGTRRMLEASVRQAIWEGVMAKE